MELSELCLFEGSLYSFDDRSGLVYEIVDFTASEPKAYPRYVLMEGDADTDKGFKAEWATVKVRVDGGGCVFGPQGSDTQSSAYCWRGGFVPFSRCRMGACTWEALGRSSPWTTGPFKIPTTTG